MLQYNLYCKTHLYPKSQNVKQYYRMSKMYTIKPVLGDQVIKWKADIRALNAQNTCTAPNINIDI